MRGSIQLRRYIYERDSGKTREDACFWSGVGAEEAKLTDLALERGELADIEPLGPEPMLAGHNRPPKEETMADSIAADELRTLIERVERLEEEKANIGADIKDVYAEAKTRGYDTRTMRECVKLRKLERSVREDREALLETYKAALGMDYAETPLGRATVSEAMRKTVEAVNAGALGEGVTATFHPAH